MGIPFVIVPVPVSADLAFGSRPNLAHADTSYRTSSSSSEHTPSPAAR
jgi:hypothetical protein